ncbi:hypothetical protein A9G17_03065 [Gilliamella sp. wkB7]|uniref:GNAT family N-acetyltransferase n=1 Tax=Gilliamella sp. wkB7 TaxID=3120264 RepID=UPI0008105D77|nr:GNAT family N-acetyltransferase [Gilliamella apicola]OCF92171.1 hypothetical protein A9G17_03065 [Gilliamella apicola]
MEILLVKSDEYSKYYKKLKEVLDKENKETNYSVGIVDLISNAPYFHFITVENDEPLGIATVIFFHEIFKLYVVPEKRKSHVASELVKHTMSFLKTNDEHSLFIEYTEQSKIFWEQFLLKNKLDYIFYRGQSKFSIKLK